MILHEPKSGPLGSSRQTWRGVTDAEICSEILLFNRLLVGLLQEKHIPINSQNIGSSYRPSHGSLMNYAFLRLTAPQAHPICNFTTTLIKLFEDDFVQKPPISIKSTLHNTILNWILKEDYDCYMIWCLWKHKKAMVMYVTNFYLRL